MYHNEWKRRAKIEHLVKGGNHPNQNQQHHNMPLRREISAGGVVYKVVNGELLIGFILDPYKKWIFAKGHVEKGEAIVDAAIRETREEMGIQAIKVKQPLGSIVFWFQRNKTRIRKTVHYFLMETEPHEVGTPQKEEYITAIRWVKANEAGQVLGYKNTRTILDRALKALQLWYARYDDVV